MVKSLVLTVAAVAALTVLALFGAAPRASAADEGQRVILVLDASGSMWGKIDGKPKIAIAREVVGRIIKTWKPEDEIGLVAYGHRKKGACDDIEVLSEPGKLDAKDFMSKVNALSPKGKTPMTQAVRMAAEALKYTEKQATVILVSDGIETCDPDPCAVAGELEKLGVNLTVHTVGFGIDDKGAVAQLKCLADKTGGISIIAENADQLEDALTKTVDAKVEPAPPPPEPAEPGKNVKGEIEMAEGVAVAKPYESPVWEFFKSVNGERGDHVTTEYGPKIAAAIPEPGPYILRVSDDAASLDVPFSVEQGKPVELALSFEAGVLSLKGMMDDKTPIAKDSGVWELSSTGGEHLSTKYGATASFMAPAGTYKLKLSVENAEAEQEVTVTAGKTTDITMSLGAGMIEASAVYTAGGEKTGDSTALELRKGEAALDGSHEGLRTEYGSSAQFSVPAGKYIVHAQADYAVGDAEVEVKPGQAVKVEVVLNAGFLSVTAPGAGQIHVYEGKKSLSGERKEVTWEQSDSFNKALNAGTYHVVAQDANGAPLAEKDFEVKAGERTEGTVP